MELRKYFVAAFLGAAFSIPSVGNAALIERLGGLAWYDDGADLTWLTDANYAATQYTNSGGTEGDADGRMTWDQANAWAASLNVGGIDGWRLADSDACYWLNCTDSEMGNLFYNVLGGSPDSSITVTHNANYGLFSNVQSDQYWLATEYAPDTSSAWRFSMDLGRQTIHGKTNAYYAWAVQSGDVVEAVSTVPAPAAVWLFGSGLLGLIGVAKRKKA